MASSYSEDEEMPMQRPIKSASEINMARTKLLDKISQTDAHFKSQLLGEPDLTFLEKRQIALSILEKGPGQFLARFHNYMDQCDVRYFEQFRDDYEIDFYIKEILKRSSKARKIQVKNRRYEALKKLISEGSYFSDLEMKERNPLMFQQLIGQYMNEDEKEELNKIDKSDLRFTNILMEHIARDYEENFRHQQEEEEERELFEENDDDDDDDKIDFKTVMLDSMSTENNVQTISEEEKRMLRKEFLTNMYQSFLDGRDAGFNYSSVDDNADYDALDIKQQDAEDKYFDSEEPETK